MPDGNSAFGVGAFGYLAFGIGPSAPASSLIPPIIFNPAETDPLPITLVRVAQFIALFNGNPNGNLVGTAGSSTTPPDIVWDYANQKMWFCTTGGTATTSVWKAVTPT